MGYAAVILLIHSIEAANDSLVECNDNLKQLIRETEFFSSAKACPYKISKNYSKIIKKLECCSENLECLKADIPELINFVKEYK